MKVLGIDPGTVITGIGIVEENESGLKCIYAGKVRTSPNSGLSVRLNNIFDELQKVIAEYSPDESAVENLFFARDATAALKLGHARGVALLAIERSGLPVAEYMPTEVKKSVLGYGRGTKDQIQHMVKLILNLPDTKMLLDVSDALAVAICHIHNRGTEEKLKRAR